MPLVVSTGEVTVLQVTPHGSNRKTVGSTGFVELCMVVAVMVATGCLPPVSIVSPAGRIYDLSLGQ